MVFEISVEKNKRRYPGKARYKCCLTPEMGKHLPHAETSTTQVAGTECVLCMPAVSGVNSGLISYWFSLGRVM